MIVRDPSDAGSHEDEFAGSVDELAGAIDGHAALGIDHLICPRAPRAATDDRVVPRSVERCPQAARRARLSASRSGFPQAFWRDSNPHAIRAPRSKGCSALRTRSGPACRPVLCGVSCAPTGVVLL